MHCYYDPHGYDRDPNATGLIEVALIDKVLQGTTDKTTADIRDDVFAPERDRRKRQNAKSNHARDQARLKRNAESTNDAREPEAIQKRLRRASGRPGL